MKASPADIGRVMFDGIVDDAALFPPAALSMEDAVSGHIEARQSPEAWMLSRFICPINRLPELASALERRGDSHWPLAVTAAPMTLADIDDAMEGVLAFEDRTSSPGEVKLIELAPGSNSIRELEAIVERVRRHGRGARVAIELKRDESWAESLRLLPAIFAGRSIALAKIRCGGLAESDFPSVAELAAFIAACVDADVPFKATAGLHEPVRHGAPDGITHHGFVNLLTATALAQALYEDDVLCEVLAEEDATAFAFDPGGFTWRGLRFGRPQIAEARARFIGFGSCSFSEPVAGLRRMGALPQPDPVAT